jgi:hypothetical protein
MLINEQMLMTNYHLKQTENGCIELAGMRCCRIPPEALTVGDFLYHYSNQLDAFSHYEVTEVVEPGKSWRAVCIDNDMPSAIGTSRVFSIGHGMEYRTPYRAMVEERLALEKSGGAWEGDLDYISMLAGKRDTTRRLANTLYWKPVSVAQGLRRWWQQIFSRQG